MPLIVIRNFRAIVVRDARAFATRVGRFWRGVATAGQATPRSGS
jgi:hypothetical protein